MNSNSFFWGTIFMPKRSWKALLDEPRAISKAWRMILFLSLLFSLEAFCLGLAGAEIIAPAWIAIPSENYYFWQSFIVFPVFGFSWILISALAHLWSKGLRGKGTFEGTLSVMGYALSLPLFILWLLRIAGALLLLSGLATQGELVEELSQPGFLQSFFFGYHGLVGLWLFGLVSGAIGVSQKLRFWKAFFLGLLISGIFIIILAIFIR